VLADQSSANGGTKSVANADSVTAASCQAIDGLSHPAARVCQGKQQAS
jgi:hypothetical protein